MHQWSTSTHKTISDPAKDNGIFQYQLPRWALKHGFLFNGIMSISALEIALSDDAREGRDSVVYARVGIEYYDKAILSFRAQLPKLPPENAHLTFIFSSILNLINMAIPQCMPVLSGDSKESVQEHMGQFMDLMSGSSSLFLANQENIQTGPIAVPVNGAIASALDSLSTCMTSDVEGVFTRLGIILNFCDPESFGTMEGTKGSKMMDATKLLDLPVYQRAIKMLRLCYAEEAKPGNIGFCMGFSSLAGPAFTSAFRNSEPLALYIALHWAVLLHGLEAEYWWGKGVGRSLAKELFKKLSVVEVHPAVQQHWKLGLAYAREQIGLPTRNDSPLEEFLKGWEDG